MRSYALLFAVGSPVLPLAAGCGTEHDYRVAVSWLINGMVPDPGICQEQGIVRGRFEVYSGGGKHLQTLEGNCTDQVDLSDGNRYGGFVTTEAFDWERTYSFTLALVDANGNAVSVPVQDEFYLGYDEAEFYELGYLDYVQPLGASASLYGEWSVRSGDVATACLAERIATVRIYAASALDIDLLDPVQVAEASCAQGQFTSNGNLLAIGNYWLWYEAVSDGGAVAERGAAIPVLVDGSAGVVLPRETFLSN